MDVAIGVGQERLLECCQLRMSWLQHPGKRVARACPDQIGAAGDDPRLRTPEQLVARERDEGSAGVQRLAGRGGGATRKESDPGSHGVVAS